MKFFKRMFGFNEERKEGRRMIAESMARAKSTYGPLGSVALAIVDATDRAQREIVPSLGFSSRGTPSEQQIYVCYELLYFFSHVTMRSAVAAGLTRHQVIKLQEFVGPLLASTAIDWFFSHWPDDLKQKMTDEFFEKLNDAEMDYATCTSLVSENDPFDQQAIAGKLASNIAMLLEQPSNPAIIIPVIVAVTSAYSSMGLKLRMKEVQSVIDQMPEI